ncbi:immunity 53 family protein [Phyllobacterium sp. 22552]|uniref:immunity 53 family protein n=1 Tax=Phyllobacterium sp. 22552 TaxID=3453941 RepID=UPI003F83299A
MADQLNATAKRATPDGTELAKLQAWYKSHCDGEWELHQAIKISTLDNPGWHVQIDLRSTSLVDEYHRFEPKQVDYEHETNWYTFNIENDIFTAAGGPETLLEILREFLDFAEPDSKV